MPKLKLGYNMLTEIDGVHSDMMMDTGIYVFSAGETMYFLENSKEVAFLPLSGKLKIEWTVGGQSFERIAQRNSLFDEKPVCLHVPRNIIVKITAETSVELLVQKTVNTNDFPTVFYESDDIEEKILCEGLMADAATRLLRDIFNYENAPYSNMVMGEVITFPGKWSSYPPHHHPQPEVYFYRFNEPQGFGVSIIGDNAQRVENNSFVAIPGGLVHPQVSAPGYAMYYCWMIRHFKGRPWTERIDDPSHTWLYDKESKIWHIPEGRLNR